LLRSAGLSFFASAALLGGPPSLAAADIGPLVLAVPDGFDTPASSDHDGGVTTAWTKRRPGTADTTLLQVSVLDGGAAFDEASADDRFEGARHYLLEFVRAVGRTEDHFELAEIEHAALAGLPAARARWTGKVADKPVVGVMYCVLVGHSIVSLRTEDAGPSITPAMYGAIAAIEAVRRR
jgi:hypothetical protein